MGFRSERQLDDLDWQILDALQTDGRLSFKELGRRINLSAPAVADRVRRLEDSGVIRGYSVQIDAQRAGYPILAFVELRCSRGGCLLATSSADEHPEIIEVHKLSGAYCSMVKARATSLEHLESLLERLGRHGDTRSTVVLSTQYEDAPIRPLLRRYQEATRHDGWSHG